MPNSIVPIHHIFVEWYKEILATFLIAFGIVYKFGKQEEKINNISTEVEEQGEEINETQGLMEAFHGKCDQVNAVLSKTVTVKDLRTHCEKSQQNCTTNLCRKIAEIKQAQATSTKELRGIAVFMARIEEQHKTDVIIRKGFIERLEKINEIQLDIIQEVAILKKSKV